LYVGFDMHAVLRRILKNGGEYADLYLERSSPLAIQCEDDRIEKVIAGRECGAGLRVISGKRTTYAYTNELTTSSLLELAEAMSRSVSVRQSSGERSIAFLGTPIGGNGSFVKQPPEKVSTDKKAFMVKRANHIARNFDPRVRQVQVTYREHCQEILIATSAGEVIEDTRQYLTAMVHIVASDGVTVQTGYESVGGLTGMEIFDVEPLEIAAEKATRRALMMLTARKAPAGRMAVVLSSDAGGTMIHEAIGHGLEADLAQSGLSVYSGKVGQQIASPLVTVVDDATLPGKRGSFRVDDEGTKAQRTVLVEQGILKTYLYDRLTAMKDGTLSTGNGRRESYRHRPIPRMTNTMIEPGATKPADILKATQTGLFVRKMGGGQVNTVNGDFVFEVSEGYLIKNGRIGDPVRGATLVGNGPNILMSIDLVGSDLGFSIGTCGKDGQGSPVSDAQPTLRIPEITVGGEVE
jgi:TldD protein